MSRPLLISAVSFVLGVFPARVGALKALGPGDPVPPFSVADEEAGARPAAELLGPKGALLVFWASWNPRSREILDYARELDRAYRDRGLRVVPINAEREGLTAEQVRELAGLYRSWSLPWASYYDVRLEAFSALGIITFPTSVYLGADLRLQGAYPGFPAEAREALPELVEKGLGVWSPPVQIRRAEPVRYVPKNGAGQRLQTARLLLARGQPRKAASEARAAAEKDPDYASAQGAAASLSRADGADPEPYLERLRSRADREPPFREALGAALLALDRPAEARASLEPLLSLEEPLPRGLVGLAYLRHAAGDAAGSRSVLDRLKAWPLGGVPLEVDVREWFAADRPLEEQWNDPRAVALRLLGLAGTEGRGGAER